MKVNFNELPDAAKVWVYQSSDKLNDAQKKIILDLSEDFLDEWESHGIPVQGSVDVLNNLFIRVSAFTNEASMCGRAQDAQVKLAKELEGELNVELTNRMLLAFSIEGENKIVHMNDVPDLVKAGEIKKTTPFFNNLIQSKKEYKEGWETKAEDSWLSRYF